MNTLGLIKPDFRLLPSVSLISKIVDYGFKRVTSQTSSAL